MDWPNVCRTAPKISAASGDSCHVTCRNSSLGLKQQKTLNNVYNKDYSDSRTHRVELLLLFFFFSSALWNKTHHRRHHLCLASFSLSFFIHSTLTNQWHREGGCVGLCWILESLFKLVDLWIKTQTPSHVGIKIKSHWVWIHSVCELLVIFILSILLWTWINSLMKWVRRYLIGIHVSPS